MFCMKCGKETEEDRVFCPSCLQVMERYPIKPDAAVHLPKRPPRPTEKKAPRKKEPTVAELRQLYRKILKGALLVISVLLVLVLLLSGLLIEAVGGTLPFFGSF